MSRGLAFRRHKMETVKTRVRRLLIQWGWYKPSYQMRGGRYEPPVDAVGRMAAVHCKPCSCEMCGNPRRSTLMKSERLTMQERRAMQEEE